MVKTSFHCSEGSNNYTKYFGRSQQTSPIIVHKYFTEDREAELDTRTLMNIHQAYKGLKSQFHRVHGLN
jgi:hypothetical protein